MGTRWVRMLAQLGGGRYDDRPWPPAGGMIEIPDWEADLIVGNVAIEVPPEEQPGRKPAPKPEQPPAPAPAQGVNTTGEVLQAPAGDSGEAGTGTEPGGDDIVPRAADPKRSWVDYAVSQGADRAEATAMTKEDLQSQYGGRL